MSTAYIEGVGAVDDSANVWALFQADVRGGYGLYAGQLINELAQKLPALMPRIDETLRRGLVSDDAAERAAALAGAYQLRGRLQLGAEVLQLAERHPQEARTQVFMDVLASQPATPALTQLLRALWSQPLDADARSALGRSWASRAPHEAVQALLRALADGDETMASPLIDALSATPAFDDVVARAQHEPIETRARLVALAFKAGADSSPAVYERWLELARRLDATPSPLPERPVETDAMRDFAARIPELIARDEVAERLTIPTQVVLSAEVWVDLLRTPDGPPAQLINQLRARGVAVLASEAIVDAVLTSLARLGWDDARRAQAAANLRALATLAPGASEPAVALAAGIDRVYGVGPRVGHDEAGVAVRPVHELLSILG